MGHIQLTLSHARYTLPASGHGLCLQVPGVEAYLGPDLQELITSVVAGQGEAEVLVGMPVSANDLHVDGNWINDQVAGIFSLHSVLYMECNYSSTPKFNGDSYASPLKLGHELIIT